MKKCVICKMGLIGSQRLFCSNACKQADKYARRKGERCGKCHSPMNPMPVLGGFRKQCTVCKPMRKSKEK
jgi:hypothetical protein